MSQGCRATGSLESLEIAEVKKEMTTLRRAKSIDSFGTDGESGQDCGSEESVSSVSSRDSDDSAPCAYNHDNSLLSVGNTGVHIKYTQDTPDGTKRIALAVAAVKPKSFADRVGIQEGDCIDSVNGQKFTRPEDLCNFVKRCERNQTLNIKILRQVFDPTTGSSRLEVIVINKIYATLSTEDCLHASYHGPSFQYRFTEKFYLKSIHPRSFYFTVRKRKLALKSQYRRQNKKKKAVWKVHHFLELSYSTDSAMVVVLEHMRSKLCVSLTRNGIALKRKPDLNKLSKDDSCVFGMVREGSGMNFMFESYHRKKAGRVEFLGFQEVGGSSWNPVIITGHTRQNGQDYTDCESAIFTLFRVVQKHIL